jgi:hypothetical protein
LDFAALPPCSAAIANKGSNSKSLNINFMMYPQVY